jgi:hypothetical protein
VVNVTTQIFLARYVRDLDRGEAINVGVVVERGNSRRSRFLGQKQDSGKIDGTHVRGKFEDFDLYRGWVNHWSALLLRANASELVSRRPFDHFVVELVSEIVFGDDQDLDALVEDRFAALVAGPPKEGSVSIADRLERHVKSLGLGMRDGFKSDHLVRSLDGQDFFKFPVAYQNGILRVALPVSLFNQTYTNDALWRFTHIEQDIRRIAYMRREEDEDQFDRSLNAFTLRDVLVVEAGASDAPAQLEEYLVN